MNTAFDFTQIHPNLFFGTASDRFAGWIGQIYSENWEIKERKKSVEGMTLTERILPIASVKEYFEHFRVLELDFTFYRPLIDPDGNPTPSFHVLAQYAQEAPENALFLVKAPQKFFARKHRSKAGWINNESYLDINAYLAEFHAPLQQLLGDKIKGILFQQEYQTQKESPKPAEMVAQFYDFFQAIPKINPLHLELRSAHLLSPLYFDFLSTQGIGYCFSHWTWLPSIKEQWFKCGQAFFAKENMIRLLCPRDMPYAQALKHVYPFNQAVPALSQTPQATQMVNEAAALAFKALEQDANLSLIMNNRAFGNSPLLAQAVSHKIVEVQKRRLENAN